MSTSVESQQNISSFASDDSSSGPSIHDFVLVSSSNSFEPCSSESLKASRGEASAKMLASDCRKEDEMLEKLMAVGKENDKLKETLKGNNVILQKYIKDFTEMQENHRTNNENIKREHQRAKEVVAKLKDDNRTLKEEFKAAQLQISHEAKRERVAGLERENTFLKNEIQLVQDHITEIDHDLKDCELPEGASENWRILLGSLASYSFQTGISQPRNVESIASEMSSQSPSDETHRQSKINLEDKYAKLETEKEILKVDLEKIRVEKHHAEEMLADYNKLKNIFGQEKEEKEEIKKLLAEQCEINIKEQQEHKELENICQNLQNEVQKLNEKLHHIQEQLANTDEEKEQLSNALDAERQRQTVSQKDTAAEGNDDDEHTLCKEKCAAFQELYFKSQKQVNAMEERENTLCAKEKAFDAERKQLEETRQQLAAELDSHSKSFLEKQVNAAMEDRENTLRAKEKAFEGERKQLEETKQQLSAELDSHSKSFLEKTEQLHSELQEAREREETLQKYVIELQAEDSEREENLQEQVCQLIKENDAMRIKIEKLTELNARRDILYDERMKQMEKESRGKENEHSGFIGVLQSELGTAKEDRKKYQEQSRIIKVEHDRLAFQHDQLMKEYDELLNSFNGTLEQSKMRSNNTTAEIENYKGQMDDISVHLTSAQEEIAKKEIIISDLKDCLKRLESSWNEEVPILKEQVSVYYNDFKVEREARERQHTDLLNLQEQTQRLTQANEELQMELDNIMNNQQMAEMQRRHLAPQQASPSFNPDAFAAGYHLRGRGEADQRERYEWSAQQPPHAPDPRVQQPREPEEPFPCPGCRRNFTHFEEVENHVQRCEEAIRLKRPIVNRLECPVCANEFPDQDTLEIHVQECLRDV